MSQSFSNNINSLNTTVNFTVADERSKILAWLSPLEPRLRHKGIQEIRVENVGGWVLEAEEFRSWYASSGGSGSENAVLFCYGGPGVGKTFISSLVIDSLGDRAKGQEVAVACFYFDFAAQKEQSPASMLGAVLRQVVSGLRDVPEEIAQAYEDQKQVIGGRGPQLADITKMLQNTTSIKRIFICIDALDECVVGHRVKILNSLNQILQRSPGTRMLVTGRAHIKAEVRKGLSGRVTALRIAPRRHDIVSYLHHRLDEDTRWDAMDSSLKADILRKIPQDVSEIFLLVSLNIDAILQGTTIGLRRRKLDAMTDGLGLEGAYGETLSRIKGQGQEESKLGMAALMWISHSKRPLKADELCHALGVEIGSADLNGENVPSIGTLLACCQGLVAVDGEASTVRLIHFTLQEYLRAHPELFGRAHATMAETCLSYLNSYQVKALSASPPSYSSWSTPLLRYSSLHPGTPFLEYSSLYWGIHAKKDLSDCAKQLALKLFGDHSNHVSAAIILNKSSSFYPSFKNSSFSSLHCASFFGIVEIVASLVEAEGCDINQTDGTGSTPLVWAALKGHEGAVAMLLGRDDVNPNKPDKYGRTPLHSAVMNGHEGVVETLLGRDDINPDEPDDDGQTPLWYAALNEHQGVVTMLLERDDVNPNKPDKYGQTPLYSAVMNGHEGVVEILLGRDDVNPNKPNKYGRTPLHSAVMNGHEGVVEILLGRDDVYPDEPDDDGQTPLRYAALNEHQGMVTMLLERDDVDPNKPNKYGQTPLHSAAMNRREGVVETLLGRDDVNPDEPDDAGQTPLWLAAVKGYERAVKMLLGRDDVNPNKPDKNGRTPLWCAALNERQGVVTMLLERDDVDPGRPDINGRTPLLGAAAGGRGGVVKALLGRGDVNPDQPDNDGQTPLWWAAHNGHAEVVKMLLERHDINPDKPDKHSQTPLWCAAASGHEGVVKMLLERHGVSPDKPDEHGRTPLLCAILNRHEGVVKILFERDDVDPGRPDINGRTPFLGAAARGHEGVVKAILERGDVDPNQPDSDGQTPLWWATRNGHWGVVKILDGTTSARTNQIATVEHRSGCD